MYVRNLDELGRLTVPSEMRKRLNLDKGSYVEFFYEGDCVFIVKHGYVFNEAEEVQVARLTEQLRNRRLELGLSEEQVADLAALKPIDVVLFERYVIISRFDVLMKIAKALGMKLRLE